jgi:uncharacterized protein YlxW (UPF0749 family)
MNKNLWFKRTLLFGVAIVLGVLISIQYRTQQKVIEQKKISNDKATAVSKLVNKTKAQVSALEKEQQELLKEVEKYRNQPGATSPELKQNIDNVGILSGETAVDGPGIHIEIDDTKVILFPLYDQLMELVKTLKYGGAEAIKVNGQRIGTNSYIVPSGSNILVNGVPITRINGTHWEVEAIGNQEVLRNYIQNVIDSYTSNYSGLKISIVAQIVHVPSALQKDFNLAKSLE